jgi:hypothetical protein
MSTNTLLTIADITNEAARILVNNLVMVKGMNRQFEDRFGVEGRKAGDTVNIRKPPKYGGRRGEQANPEGSVETYVPLTLNPLYGCDLQFGSTDLTLSISNFSDRFIKPAVAKVANMIDLDAAMLYKTVYNMVGTPGTTPATAAVILAAGQRLNEEAAPLDGERSLVINPAAQAGLVGGEMKGLYNPNGTISSQFRRGRMGDDTLGFNFAMDQNIGVHTSGTSFGTGTPTLTAAPANGATSLAITGFTGATTLRKGDILKLTGIYAVNPQSKQRNTYERTVVVTDDYTLNGSGAATVNILPALYFSGPMQNIDARPASNNAIAVVSAIAAGGSYAQNLAFHRDAFTFASVPLELPRGVEDAYRIVSDSIGIRIVSQYDIWSNQHITRLDVLGGFATIYPELAVRMAG